MRLEPWLLEVWYNNRKSGWWLRPAGWLYRAVIALRAWCYRAGWFSACRAQVPVVVIGNITAGGTGKTPLVILVAELARTAGRRPGILCRGYRGTAQWPCLVTAQSDPQAVGDEAVMLAAVTGVPVVAGPDRCASVRLLGDHGVDLIISDDGLQHYRLQRDLEVAVIDGARGLGNERFIPAGPLRESPDRLATVDLVVINGPPATRWPDALAMRVTGATLVSLTERTERNISEFSGQRVHAVAGIGNPQRFFDLLRQNGLHLLEHRFADHVSFNSEDLAFDDELPIIMTGKDAVKCRAFATARMWMLPVTASFADSDMQKLQAMLLNLTSQETL